MSEEVKAGACAAMYSQLDCLKYLVEEALSPLPTGKTSRSSHEQLECKYLLEKGSPEPTDIQYAGFVEGLRAAEENSYDATD